MMVDAPSVCSATAAARDALCIELVRRHLETERIGFQMLLYREVESTSAVLRRLADAGAPEGTVVLAEAQTAGRGRLGQRWFSPPGVNLYASVLLRPAIAPAAVPLFSFIASLAVSDAIRGQGVAATIKWPNDVLIDGGKAAGTFVTCATSGGLVDYVILGVGVNVNVERDALAAALGEAARGATSVREAVGRPIDRNVFAAAFLNHLEKWADAYGAAGPEAVLEAWRRRDALAGHQVVVRGTDATHRGRAAGVNREGHLLVADDAGIARAITSGQVAVED
jgi:BirA family biotin operon repressor/biotin-[acetyl-CoA-carboxylase] ligase